MTLNIKKISLINLMLFCLSILGLSQSCLPEGIQFKTQSQINSFPIDYPNCSEIEGSVLIRGNDIQNLLGLNSITAIRGSLDIEVNNNLESLTGLNNLHSISGNLSVRSNFVLSNLMGLENLSTVMGDVLFYNNALKNFDGLSNLYSIGGTFKISQNFKLQDVDEIGNLTYVGGNLEIMSNDSLVSLQGLESLKRIGGALDIHYNDKLKKLLGIDNIDSIGGNLSIYANDSLNSCAVGGICKYITNPIGFINIHDNLQGCNSREEIKEGCDTLSILEYHSLKQFIIYPNPVIDKFSISLKNGERATNLIIYNQLGCKVLIVNRINGPIDISKLRMGLYIIEFALNGKLVRGQIAKQ